MKKVLIIVLLIMIVISLTSCKQELSKDTYDVENITIENSTFVYEKIENDVKSEIIYNLVVEDNLATYSTTIEFEDGQFRSSSTFDTSTLKATKSYKGNSYYLHPEKNWDIDASYNQFLDMEATFEGETETISLAIPDNFLDNESVIFSVGAIKEKDDLIINISTIEAAEITPYKVTWLGTSLVEVPYGEFECIRVRLEYIGIVLGEKPTLDLWYTNDENRHLIKYTNFNLEIYLKDIIGE